MQSNIGHACFAFYSPQAACKVRFQTSELPRTPRILTFWLLLSSRDQGTVGFPKALFFLLESVHIWTWFGPRLSWIWHLKSTLLSETLFMHSFERDFSWNVPNPKNLECAKSQSLENSGVVREAENSFLGFCQWSRQHGRHSENTAEMIFMSRGQMYTENISEFYGFHYQ